MAKVIQDNSDYPGELKVESWDGLDKQTHYVLMLGPIDDDAYQYDYHVISTDPAGDDLYVCARDVAQFRAKYEADVLQELHSRGFNTIMNMPRPTYQGDDCIYSLPMPLPNTPPHQCDKV